jgi:hypothetical protein
MMKPTASVPAMNEIPMKRTNGKTALLRSASANKRPSLELAPQNSVIVRRLANVNNAPAHKKVDPIRHPDIALNRWLLVKTLKTAMPQTAVNNIFASFAGVIRIGVSILVCNYRDSSRAQDDGR